MLELNIYIYYIYIIYEGWGIKRHRHIYMSFNVFGHFQRRRRHECPTITSQQEVWQRLYARVRFAHAHS
jgi:hypothetical protein